MPEKTKLFSRLEKLNDSLNETHKLVYEFQDAINLVTSSFNFVASPTFEIKYDDIHGDSFPIFETPAVFSDEWFNKGTFVRSFVREIAYVMSEQDFPVSKSNGKAFCEFFELNPKETDLIMSKCATDIQYNSFISEYDDSRSCHCGKCRYCNAYLSSEYDYDIMGGEE